MPQATAISDYGFASCTNLTDLYLPGSYVVSIGTGVFNGVIDYSVHVPASLYSSYITAENWSNVYISSRIVSIPG